MKNICDMYPDAVKARIWFKRFKGGDCNISDKPRFGRRLILNGIFNWAILLDPCQNNRDLANE